MIGYIVIMIIFIILNTVLDFYVFKKVIEPELLAIVPEFEENERKRKAAADEAKAKEAANKDLVVTKRNDLEGGETAQKLQNDGAPETLQQQILSAGAGMVKGAGTATANYMKENPDMAKNAAQATVDYVKENPDMAKQMIENAAAAGVQAKDIVI